MTILMVVTCALWFLSGFMFGRITKRNPIHPFPMPIVETKPVPQPPPIIVTQEMEETMNLNVLARMVTLKEGKKKPITIAQVKEVLKCTNEILKEHDVNLYAIIKKA